MTCRSAVRIRQLPFLNIHAAALANIRKNILPALLESCRPMPFLVMLRSTMRGWQPAPMIEAACWSHGRRNFFDLAKLNKAPIAIEAVRRIDELFEIERTINGKTPEQRVAMREEKSKPLVTALEAWLRDQRDQLSSKSETAKAITDCLARWTALSPVSSMTENLPQQQRSRKSHAWVSSRQKKLDLRRVGCRWIPGSSDFTLIGIRKMNDVDPKPG